MSKHLVQIELTEQQWAVLKSKHKSGHKAVMHAVEAYIDNMTSTAPTDTPRDIPPLEDLVEIIEAAESSIGHPYTSNPALRLGWWVYVITEGTITARRRWESEGV